MKVCYPSLFLFLLHTYMYAQPMASNEVSILSPKAASIIKYGEYPVSLYTGLIDISVPIYTIEGSGITVPIELKYHASGLKFDDVSNEVGLGWSLIAGGLIVRSFMGAKDGLHETFSKDVTTFTTCDNDPSPFTNEYVSIREIENGSRRNYYDGSIGKKDGEMDMYSFSFLDHSGSFCFPFLNSAVMGSAPNTGLFIPDNGMKAITHNNQEIEILDTDGAYYRFEVKDVDQNLSYKEYYLTQIISVDKADTIDFIYEVMSSNLIYKRRPFINYVGSVTEKKDVRSPFLMPEIDFLESGGLFYQQLRPPRLKRINFRGGYVSFDYAVINNIATWDLQQIRIYNNVQGSPLRTVSLTKGTFLNGEQRLDKVTFGSSAGESYDYRFGYHVEPGNINNYDGIDYWGYFNGGAVPYGKRYMPIPENPPILLQQGTDRTASESAMEKGILNKIIYPTKGYSEFTYEAHKARYSLATPVVTCGGLRIREIRNYLPDGTLAEKKWYKYGENESGIGVANALPDINDFFTESRALITEGYEDMPFFTKAVTIKSYSSFPKISYFISGSSVVYRQVTEYVGNASVDHGKTVYHYEVFPDERLYVTPDNMDAYRFNSPNTYLRTYPWKTGSLRSKEVYKKEGDSYQKIYSLTNTYKDINRSEFRNVRVLPPNVNFEYVGTAWFQDIMAHFCSYPEYREYFGGNYSNSRITPYDYFNYYITSGLRVLSSTGETIDGVTTYTSYDTHNENGLPTSITRTTSAEENTVTMLRYPTDFTYPPYSDMQAANILTPVIEKATYKNGSPLKKEKTGYAFWHSRFYAPLNYELGYLNENPVTRVMYSYDPKGNMREISKDGTTKGVYLWGYNYRYPVAEIRGTTYGKVKNILGETLIDRVGNAIAPSSADFAAINNLRDNTSLSGASITTYAYRPLVGMTLGTDPNGLPSRYEYDTFGRLTYERDHEENVLKKYNYQYVPPSAPFNVGVSFDENSRKYTISWEVNSSDETGFEVVVSVGGLAFEPVVATGSNFQYAVDPTIRDVGQTVRYGVRSVYSSGASAYTYSSMFTVPSIIAPLSVGALYDESTARYTVSWKDASNIETSYKVEASLNNGTYTTLTSSLPTNTMGYLDHNIYETGTAVKYRVTAINGSQQSEGKYSPKYIVPDIRTPLAPSGINAVFSTSTEKITITWNDNSDNEQYFELQVSVDGSGWAILDNGIEGANYTDDNLYGPGKVVKYRVRATNPRAVSGWNESTGILIPFAPTNGQASKVGVQTGILVTWDDNSSGEGYFKIYRSENGGSFISWTTADPGSTSKLDVSGLAWGNTYRYRISAVTASGETSYTETNSVLFLDPPEAPSHLEVAQNGDDITLAWHDNSYYEDSFIVLLDYGLGGGWVTWATVDRNVKSYSFRNENFSGEIGFKVGAANAAGTSSWSTEVYITIEQ